MISYYVRETLGYIPLLMVWIALLYIGALMKEPEIVASKFYENVDDGKGGSKVLEFTPRTGELMLIACLVSHWTDPKGELPPLWSFAAVTDEPEPEVAAAGHDRTIINIKPEHVDGWLNPDPTNLEALFAIMDDKRHPYYEHRLAA